MTRLDDLEQSKARGAAGPRAAGFTLVELLVVIGIIGVLVSILLPTLSVVRRSGQRVACREKLHDIANLCQMYLNDSKGVLWQVNAVPWIQPPLNNLPSLPEVFAPYVEPHGAGISYPVDPATGQPNVNGTGWTQMGTWRRGWLCPVAFC